MRNELTLGTATVALAVLLAGCGSGSGTDRPGAGTPGAGSTATTGNAPSSAPQPANPPAPGGTPPGATPPPDPGDLPGGLPGPARTFTGTVQRSGGCTMLVVGSRQFALTGPQVSGLTPGTRMTVVGSPAAMPPECASYTGISAMLVERATPA